MGTTLEKKSDVTTALGNKQSIVVFFIALLIIFGLFFMFKTYQELSGENIVIESEEDVVAAEETIAANLEQLEKDKEALRALIT